MSFRRSLPWQLACMAAVSAACMALALRGAAAQASVDQGSPCASVLSCTASGEGVDRLRPAVDGVVAGALADETPANAGRPVLSAIVGVSWHGKRGYFGFGRNAPPYAPDTIVEIGSITKVFTTALLAEAVEERSVGLDDRLNDYKDALGLDGLTRCGANVTLRQLADFSSGMPRQPDDLPPVHDIGHYSTKQFDAWVSRWVPRGTSPDSCSLPQSYVYSNASVGLLGYIVAQRSGKPYARLIADRITAPLGMSSTFLPEPDGSVPASLARRVAVGRAKDGRPAKPWPYYAWFAAGALRSDAEDMLSFGEAALGRADIDGAAPSSHRAGVVSLESALKTAQSLTYPVSNPEGGVAFDQGLSWVRRQGDPARGLAPLTLKDGGTGGFSTVLVLNQAKDLAVFVAVGKAGVNIDALGIRLSRVIR